MFNAPVNSGEVNNTPKADFAYMNEDIGKGDGVYISTYGCQMNVNDTERMYSLLEMVNFVPVPTPEQAKLIILNSCSVREKPVHKIFSEVGRYRRMKEQNPQIKIGVGGCVAQQEKQNLVQRQPLIDFVFGTDNIDQLPEIVAKARQNQKVINARFEMQKPYYLETLLRNPGVTAFVNITKGCDNFCTFCVVPFTRGRERSRPLRNLIEDIQTLTKRGVKEVTLIGQNVNSYKSECGGDFTALMKAVCEETDISRIRYTTPHPKDFNQELVELSQKYRAKICDSIHLPAQSGNTEVLARMNRGYSREEYLDKVKMIRQAIPGVSLTTDLIVGFPGETDAQYEDTLSLVDIVDYDNIYAFKYSPRPFTKAAKYTDQVDEAVKDTRLTRLIEFHKEKAFAKVSSLDGQIVEILVEQFDPTTQRLNGRTTQNKVVHFDGDKNLVGQMVKVKVLKAFPATVRGELV